MKTSYGYCLTAKLCCERKHNNGLASGVSRSMPLVQPNLPLDDSNGEDSIPVRTSNPITLRVPSDITRAFCGSESVVDRRGDGRASAMVRIRQPDQPAVLLQPSHLDHRLSPVESGRPRPRESGNRVAVFERVHLAERVGSSEFCAHCSRDFGASNNVTPLEGGTRRQRRCTNTIRGSIDLSGEPDPHEPRDHLRIFAAISDCAAA